MLFAAAVLVLLTIITAVILFWRVIRTAASVETNIATNFYLTAGEKFGIITGKSMTGIFPFSWIWNRAEAKEHEESHFTRYRHDKKV